MRKIIWLAVIFLFIFLIAFSFSEIENTLLTLEKASMGFMLVALALQIGYIFAAAHVYRSLYALMGIKESARHLALVATAANFVNVVAPSAGIGGVAIFISDARKHGHPNGRVLAASALSIFIDYVSLLVILLLGFTVLFRRNAINAGEVSAAIVLTIATTFFAWLIFLGTRYPHQFERILHALSRRANQVLRPFFKRDYISEKSVTLFAAEVAEGFAILRTEHKDLFKPLFFSLVGRTMHIGILWMSFLSFKVAYSLGTVVAGYAIGYLFLVVTPTPAGIGFVEGGLPLVLVTLRVPFEQGLLVTLAYRAVTFWFPLGLGGPALRYLRRTSRTVETAAS